MHLYMCIYILYIHIHVFLAGTQPALHRLAVASRRRIKQAFRPGTRTNHLVQLKTFFGFCLHFGLDYVNPSTLTLCSYIEFLATSLTSPMSVGNYFSIIRLMHAAIHTACPALDSLEVKLMLRAVKITMTHIPRQAPPITKDVLLKLCDACTILGKVGPTIKCALLFGFFGFLRRSNIVPDTVSGFDPLRHTCRGDILLEKPGIVLILKWSKTRQDHSHVHLVPMPNIPGHPLCPVQAFQDMCITSPTITPNQPLFVLPRQRGRYRALTVSELNKYFKLLLSISGMSTNAYSLHSLRRGGATCSFNAGIAYIHIKRHGDWRSDAFWSYIASSQPAQSPVPRLLRKHFQATSSP